MYSDQSMEETIKTAIEPWTLSKKKPPFAEEQLFTMALLMVGESMTEKEVFQWILDHFGYYRQLAADSYYTSWPHWSPTRALHKASNEFRANLSRVPQLFDFPLELANIDDGGRRYSISVADGKRILSQTLGLEASTQAFPFLRLPAELRNAVYDIVFRYPKSGLCSRSHHEKRKNVACVGTRSLDQDIDLKSIDHNQLLVTMPIKRIPAPLLVCRQFYREAMPCFYSINNFYFPSHFVMHEILEILPSAHRNHIKHVTFTFNVMDPAGAFAAITRLSKIGGLRKLTVHIDEKAWISMGEFQLKKSTKFSSVLNMPGVSALGKTKGLEEVTFHGCPEVEAAFKSEMLEPKPTKKTASGSKKRKGAGTSGDDKVASQNDRAKKAKTG